MEQDKNYSLVKLFFILTLTSGSIYFSVCLAVYAVMMMTSGFIADMSYFALLCFKVMLTLGITYILLTGVSIFFRREIIPFIPTHKVWMKTFVRVAKKLAPLFGMSGDELVKAFILLHNDFVINELCRRKNFYGRALILLPHCLQLASCPHKITFNLNNCKRCGACVIAEFISLSEEIGIDIFVATGGTAARKAIRQARPEFVIAVACERDLLSGIEETLSIPVIGVINERPNGDCYNTTVDVSQIRKILLKMPPVSESVDKS